MRRTWCGGSGSVRIHYVTSVDVLSTTGTKTYTGFLGELEHLKIETRLIDEMFSSVMGEYVFLK